MKSNDAVYQTVAAFLKDVRLNGTTREAVDAVAKAIGNCPGAAFKGLAGELVLHEGAGQGACAGKTMAMLDYLKHNANPNSLASVQITPSALWKAQNFPGRNNQGMPAVAMAFFDHLYGSFSEHCAPRDVTLQTEC